MKKIKYFFIITLLALLAVSCDSDDDKVVLITPEYKNLELLNGGKFDIPVTGTNWYIESVEDLSSGSTFVDKEQTPVVLEGYGEVESANGWLTLERNEENYFTIHLKENFRDTERRFAIWINDNGNKDYVTVIQKRGESYRLVKSELQEIEEYHKIYKSDKGCQMFVFTNPTSEKVEVSTDAIFKDVVYYSHFESDDYGAFGWIPEGKEVRINSPGLPVEGGVMLIRDCVYKEGVTTEPGKKDKSSFLLLPYATAYVWGEIIYLERKYNYTFTIENESSGSRFLISGIWTQRMPISWDTTFSDKPKQ